MLSSKSAYVQQGCFPVPLIYNYRLTILSQFSITFSDENDQTVAMCAKVEYYILWP